MIHLLFLRLSQLSRRSLYLMCFNLQNDFAELCWTFLSTAVSQQSPHETALKIPSPCDEREHLYPSACYLLSCSYSSSLLTFPDTSLHDWLRFGSSLAKAPGSFPQNCILDSLQSQVQDSVVSYVELHEVPVAPVLQQAKAALDCWTCPLTECHLWTECRYSPSPHPAEYQNPLKHLDPSIAPWRMPLAGPWIDNP